MVNRRRHTARTWRSMPGGIRLVSLARFSHGLLRAYQQAPLCVCHGRFCLDLGVAFAILSSRTGITCASWLVRAVADRGALHFYPGLLARAGQLSRCIPASLPDVVLLLVVGCLCLGAEAAPPPCRSLSIGNSEPGAVNRRSRLTSASDRCSGMRGRAGAAPCSSNAGPQSCPAAFPSTISLNLGSGLMSGARSLAAWAVVKTSAGSSLMISALSGSGSITSSRMSRP